jgi:hypothetical protein
MCERINPTQRGSLVKEYVRRQSSVSSDGDDLYLQTRVVTGDRLQLRKQLLTSPGIFHNYAGIRSSLKS